MSEPHVVIHTDGACSGNPGPGGWGAILAFGDREKELKGGEAHTTNNRMELMAAIAALEALKRACLVDIHTDSQYLRNGILTWINQWKSNGWRSQASQERRSLAAARCAADTSPGALALGTWARWPFAQRARRPVGS